MAKKKAAVRPPEPPPPGGIPEPGGDDAPASRMPVYAQLSSIALIAVLASVFFIEGCWISMEVRGISNSMDVDNIPKASNNSSIPAEDRSGLLIDYQYRLQQLELRERFLVTAHLLVGGTTLAVIGCALVVFSVTQLQNMPKDKVWLTLMMPGTLAIVLGVLMTIYAAPKTSGSRIDWHRTIDTIINRESAETAKENDTDKNAQPMYGASQPKDTNK